MADTTISLGLAKIEGRNRCKHPLRHHRGSQTGPLRPSFNALLDDLIAFGESFKQPPKKAVRAKHA